MCATVTSYTVIFLTGSGINVKLRSDCLYRNHVKCRVVLVAVVVVVVVVHSVSKNDTDVAEIWQRCC